MSGKHFGLWALVVAFVGTSAVRAEDPPPVPGEPLVQPTQYAGDGGALPAPPPPPAEPAPVPQLSRWITGPACDCCGPFGQRTLGYEVYLRNGVSLPFGGGVLAKDLDVGWAIQGGARVLIFDQPKLAAWTVDLGVTNINNPAQGEHPATLENIIVPGPSNIFGQSTSQVLPSIDVTFHRYNRTFVSAGFGREWYLWDPANSCGFIWRAGFDAGPRYGTSKLDLNELPHRTRVIGGAFVSVHSDVEWPCGACIYQAGFRAEWSYTFSEILQDQNNADVQDILLMFNLGVRF
jgi:hypothetical protein